MKQTNKNNNNKILLFLFLITVIPTIIVYTEHAVVEFNASQEAISETKKIKTAGEAFLFQAIAAGYIMMTVWILFAPKHRIPYIVIIVGTIAVIIFYYISRIYPVPIPFTDVVIMDRTIDWRDLITKICQTIMLPVVTAAMLVLRKQ